MIRWQYTHGVPDQTIVSPDGQSLDNFYLARPGADEIQLDLFGDSVRTSRRSWPCGAGTTHSFYRPAPRRSNGTILVRLSASSTPVISR